MFSLEKVKRENSQVILNLMQLYTYELSQYEDNTTNFIMQDNGLYKLSQYVFKYWDDENRYPYILKCDEKLAGFALIRFNENSMYEIAEFFVLPAFRKNGAGRFMATTLFDKYKGKWEVSVLLKNKGAQEFWRKTILKYTNNNFKECYIHDNSRYGFYFKSREQV